MKYHYNNHGHWPDNVFWSIYFRQTKNTTIIKFKLTSKKDMVAFLTQVWGKMADEKLDLEGLSDIINTNIKIIYENIYNIKSRASLSQKEDKR